jgi:hypothetical protein
MVVGKMQQGEFKATIAALTNDYFRELLRLEDAERDQAR